MLGLRLIVGTAPKPTFELDGGGCVLCASSPRNLSWDVILRGISMSCRKMSFPNRLMSLQSHQLLPHHPSSSRASKMESDTNRTLNRGRRLAQWAMSLMLVDSDADTGSSSDGSTGIPPSNTGPGLDASPTRQPTNPLTSRRRLVCPDTNACVRLRRPTEKSTRTPHWENLQTREVPEDRVVFPCDCTSSNFFSDCSKYSSHDFNPSTVELVLESLLGSRIPPPSLGNFHHRKQLKLPPIAALSTGLRLNHFPLGATNNIAPSRWRLHHFPQTIRKIRLTWEPKP